MDHINWVEIVVSVLSGAFTVSSIVLVGWYKLDKRIFTVELTMKNQYAQNTKWIRAVLRSVIDMARESRMGNVKKYEDSLTKALESLGKEEGREENIAG